MNKPIIGITQGKTPYWRSTEIYRWKMPKGDFFLNIDNTFSIPIDTSKFDRESIIARVRRKGRVFCPFNFAKSKNKL